MRHARFCRIALLAGELIACAPVPRMPSRITAGPHPRRFLRVVTFNLYNPPVERRARFSTQLETLRRIDADVVALQEVATGIHLRGEPASFLAEGLGFGGVRFWQQENQGLFRTGLGLLSRFPISQAQYHAFDESILFDPKGYVSATLTLPDGPLTIVCLHLASTEDRRIMASQLHQLARGLDALAASGPVLVLGDFNTEPADPLFVELVANLRADTLWDHLPPDAIHPTWNESLEADCSRDGGERIDHVLIVPGKRSDRRWRFVGGRVVTPRIIPHPSDHCAVVADLFLEITR
jgi:endonuclease/exonuclease/phosphatase family metal-dependent hydrolase